MNTPLGNLKTTRDAIRIRKVSVNTSKLKLPKSSSQSKFSFKDSKKSCPPLIRIKNSPATSRCKQNLADVEPSTYPEEDSVLLTLNELLEPIKSKEKMKNHQLKDKAMVSQRIFESKAGLPQGGFFKRKTENNEKLFGN